MINQFFNERVNLLSSKDLEEFDLRLENIKNSLSSYFTDSTLLNDSINELEEIYGMAVGYGRFEIVSIVPLIRIYRIDINDNIAVSYVQQFILYRVKSKNEGIQKDIIIPKEWIVPNENGVWREASSDYYTIILNKKFNEWKIIIILRDDINNEKIPINSLSRFINLYLPNFPPPPKHIIELPKDIKIEINNFSIKITPNDYPGWMYKEQEANYADNWWNSRNTPKYPSYDADCANFISQCLYDELGGRFRMDWNNNGISEQPFPKPPNSAISQEWHINLYSNYNPSYSWTWNPCQDYYAIYNIEGSQYGLYIDI
ncbi:MAG: amidase domain-containing protein [Caldisericia bacterium]|nr:amidase domain-containing protein [Caldisericia bacterium]